MPSEEIKKDRSYKKFIYRGVPLNELMEMPLSKFMDLLPSKKRRRFVRGITQREVSLLRKCAIAKKKQTSTFDKPKQVNTHARTMIIVPQLVGNIVGVHNGKKFVPVEVKAEMIGYYLKDFVNTKKGVSHGKAGIGATSGSKFVSLK